MTWLKSFYKIIQPRCDFSHRGFLLMSADAGNLALPGAFDLPPAVFGLSRPDQPPHNNRRQGEFFQPAEIEQQLSLVGFQGVVVCILLESSQAHLPDKIEFFLGMQVSKADSGLWGLAVSVNFPVGGHFRHVLSLSLSIIVVRIYVASLLLHVCLLSFILSFQKSRF